MACGHPPHRLAAFAGLREMTAPHRKRPRDFNQAAKMVIDIATQGRASVRSTIAPQSSAVSGWPAAYNV
jgi:hypothetical protein